MAMIKQDNKWYELKETTQADIQELLNVTNIQIGKLNAQKAMYQALLDEMNPPPPPPPPLPWEDTFDTGVLTDRYFIDQDGLGLNYNQGG